MFRWVNVFNTHAVDLSFLQCTWTTLLHPPISQPSQSTTTTVVSTVAPSTLPIGEPRMGAGNALSHCDVPGTTGQGLFPQIGTSRSTLVPQPPDLLLAAGISAPLHLHHWPNRRSRGIHHSEESCSGMFRKVCFYSSSYPARTAHPTLSIQQWPLRCSDQERDCQRWWCHHYTNNNSHHNPNDDSHDDSNNTWWRHMRYSFCMVRYRNSMSRPLLIFQCSFARIAVRRWEPGHLQVRMTLLLPASHADFY